MTARTIIIGLVVAIATLGCGPMKKTESEFRKKIEAFAPIEIQVPMDHLSASEREVVKLLVQAAEHADAIFWKQTAADAVAIRDEFLKRKDAASLDTLAYILINYGPYDREDLRRFAGAGPSERPPGGTFYPADMTKEEFEAYLKAHPDETQSLMNLYTVVRREGSRLIAVPYHEEYKSDVAEMSRLLMKASETSDNESLKQYLAARAKAISSDDYYASDVLWMKLKDNAIDVVIGPIENYEDGLFNYKAAYEAAVMVKDPEGTKELQVFQSHLDALEHNLPEKKEYIRASAGKANVLEVVNIAYFAGDFQKGVKTIAASLPNDPKVHDEYGGKKQMYKNLMEAKFTKIVKPIGEALIAEEFRPYIDRHAFTTFVTMHEVSHTLGLGYVYGNPKLEVRKALKDLFSAIEEAKADVLGIYNMEYFQREGMFKEEDMKRQYVTYLTGLFRSIRFGAEEAHGKANIAQMVFLKEQGALGRNSQGYWVVHFDKFHAGVTALAKLLLEFEAEGNYEGARKFLEQYGRLTEDIQSDLAKLKDIPRDLNTTYAIEKSL